MGRGSSKAGNGNSAKIQSFEKSIYKDDAEKAMIITAAGKIIKFSGDENNVFGTNEDIKKMEGATATHNHPNDAIFSNTDIANGIAKGNLKEMRIVTKSGEIHSIANSGATEAQRKAFSANYRNQEMKATNNLNAKARRGEKNDENKYIKQHMEKWMTNHAEEYGLRYKKRRLR